MLPVENVKLMFTVSFVFCYVALQQIKFLVSTMGALEGNLVCLSELFRFIIG